MTLKPLGVKAVVLESPCSQEQSGTENFSLPCLYSIYHYRVPTRLCHAGRDRIGSK